MKKVYIILFFILIFGAFLRFYQLGSVPSGFHRDEAFLGYNAYSILKTGKEMSGDFLPLHLKSFLYSPAGYSYFSIPFLFLFGLSESSVRMASASFGSLTIVLVYLLVLKLFNIYKLPRIVAQITTNKLALLSSFFLSISPWHINLSRTATENTIVVFFIILGIYFFLIWIIKNKFLFLLLSFFSFGLTLFIYQAPRSFLPLFIPLMIFSLMKIKIDKKSFFYISVLFFSLIIFPVLVILSSKDLSLRIRTVSLFAGRETQLRLDEEIREDGVSNFPLIASRVFHNKIIGYSSQFMQNYFNHLSYNFLFTEQGLPDRYRIPLTGLLFTIDVPFLMLGLGFILSYYRKIGIFLIGWIIITPLGSALTFDDVPNLQRTLIIFPVIPIVSAAGLLFFVNIIKKKKLIYKLNLFFIIIVFIYSFLFYIHQYYFHVNRYRPWYRQDGYKELVMQVNKYLPLYNKAIITNHESAPTIFFLFYNKYDPAVFQKEIKNSKEQSFDRISFNKFEFSLEECPLMLTKERSKMNIRVDKEVLYINGTGCEITPGMKSISEVNRKDNSLVFQLVVLDK